MAGSTLGSLPDVSVSRQRRQCHLQPVDLLERDGIALPAARLDIRPPAASRLGTRTGTVEDCAARMGITPPPPFAAGRGGARLAALCAVVDRLLAPDAGGGVAAA